MEELLSLKWNNHRSTFLHILGVLRDKQAYTDVTLACDGKFYNVHKLVLSTCSDYFSAMFDKTDKTCKSPIIVLKDIKCEDLEALLDYMYLGEVNVRQCDLASLIKSAECLRIKGLAVPDDEPPKKVPNRTESIRRDNVSGSPPPKRKRRDEGEDGRDDVRPIDVRPDVRPIVHSSPISSSRPKSPIIQRLSPSPHRTPQASPAGEERTSRPFSSPTESHPQPVATASSAGSSGGGGGSGEQQSRTEENPSIVKVERDDHEDGTTELPGDSFIDMGNDSYKEEGDSGGGADLNSDLPEFLQAAASGSLGNYSHPSFAGPSSFQPGDLSGWQGEGSSMGFPAHLNYTSDSSSQQNAPGGAVQDLEADLTDVAEDGQVIYRVGVLHQQRYKYMSQAGESTTTVTATIAESPCPICGKVFQGTKRKYRLERHMAIHTGEKPYSCHICNYRANQKEHLNRHLRNLHRLHPSQLGLFTGPQNAHITTP